MRCCISYFFHGWASRSSPKRRCCCFFSELRGPAAPEVRHQKSKTALVPSASPACSCRGGPADIVGSVLQGCPLVEPLNEDQPLSEFFLRRLCEESIEIVLTEVTDDLFAAIPRHTHSSDSTFITFTRHYRSERQRGQETPSRQRTCCNRSAATDSDPNTSSGIIRVGHR